IPLAAGPFAPRPALRPPAPAWREHVRHAADHDEGRAPEPAAEDADVLHAGVHGADLLPARVGAQPVLRRAEPGVDPAADPAREGKGELPEEAGVRECGSGPAGRP